MNQRERMLFIGVVLAGVALVGSYGVKMVAGIYTTRWNSISQLEEEIKSKEALVTRGMIAGKDLKVFRTRSLPGDVDVASSDYRGWLLEEATRAGIVANVEYNSTRVIKDQFDLHTFTLTGEVDLNEFLDLMYRFYDADHMHRIKVLSGRKTNDETFQITMIVEALSVQGVDAKKPLSQEPSRRLALETLGDYIDLFRRRNPYAPANKPPRIASTRRVNAIVGEPVNYKVEADDPEGSRMRYWVDGELPDGARLDERSGTLQWQPSETGTHQFIIMAEDEGFPPLVDTQEVTFIVGEKPADNTPRAPAFNLAQYTFLTGIVSVDGRPQVWLNNRPEGKLLKVFEGETFQVGGFSGKVVKIMEREVHIDTEDGILSVRYGQNLSEGEIREDAANLTSGG